MRTKYTLIVVLSLSFKKLQEPILMKFEFHLSAKHIKLSFELIFELIFNKPIAILKKYFD